MHSTNAHNKQKRRD